MRAWMMAVALVIACNREAPKDEKAAPAASSAKPAPSAEAPKPPQPTPVAGGYDAKVADVRVQKDAPPWIEPEGGGATGAGTLAFTLPVGDGDVDGTAEGVLGAQTFMGRLEGGRLTGSLAPKAPDAAPAFWGTVDANVEGKGDARKVAGVLRASGKDGRVVREAAFTLEKKAEKAEKK